MLQLTDGLMVQQLLTSDDPPTAHGLIPRVVSLWVLLFPAQEEVTEQSVRTLPLLFCF